MIKQWLEQRKQRKYYRDYMQGASWARHMVTDLGCPPPHAYSALVSSGYDRAFIDGARDTLKTL